MNIYVRINVYTNASDESVCVCASYSRSLCAEFVLNMLFCYCFIFVLCVIVFSFKLNAMCHFARCFGAPLHILHFKHNCISIG